MIDAKPAMVVVTVEADDDGERSGCLVGFHSQCSIEPLRYAVWLSKKNHTHEVAQRASRLTVHFLTDGDHDIAEHFGGQTGDDVDKFPEGERLLERVRHRLSGRIVDRADGGDHECRWIEVDELVDDGDLHPLRLPAVEDIDPGHDP